MHSTQPVANPFGLMLNPQAVLEAVESSDRLRGLRSRICRPLDKSAAPGDDASAAGTPESDLEAAGDEPMPSEDGDASL